MNTQPTAPGPAAEYGAHFRAWDWRRALSPTGNSGDAVFRLSLFCCALLLVVIVAAMFCELGTNARLSIVEFGFAFLTGREWNPIQGEFGALPFIYGTVVSSLIALLITVPVSLGIAIFLVEQAPRHLARPLAFLVELLAAIPSVVYGLWGIFVLAPFLREHVEPPLQQSARLAALLSGDGHRHRAADRRNHPRHHGDADHLGGRARRACGRPVSQREAALALGATKWETTRVVLANGAPGIAGAIILGLGRAVGETMAVTMVIGNRPQISLSLFDPSLHHRLRPRQRVHGSDGRSLPERARRTRADALPRHLHR